MQACWCAALFLVMVEEADFAAAVGAVLALDSAEAIRVQPSLKDAMGVLTTITLGTESGVPAGKHKMGVIMAAWFREGRASDLPRASQRW